MVKSKHVLTALYLWAVMLPAQAAENFDYLNLPGFEEPEISNVYNTGEVLADVSHYTNQILTVLDWRMTRDCLKRSDCEESNPRTRKLIEDDDIQKLDVVCGLILIGNEVIQRIATTEVRIGYNVISVGLRYSAVRKHFELGLKIDL